MMSLTAKAVNKRTHIGTSASKYGFISYAKLLGYLPCCFSMFYGRILTVSLLSYRVLS